MTGPQAPTGPGDSAPRRDPSAANGGDDSMSPPARERPPLPPPDGTDGGGSSGPGRPRISGWVGWLIFLAVIIVWNIVLFIPFGSPSSAAIPYSVFLSEAREGNVASVDFNGQSA